VKKSPNVNFKEVAVRSATRRIPLEEKVCQQCGKPFLGSKTRLHCSRACVRKAAYWRNPDAYRENRMKSYRKQKEQAAK
jgi:hypothetical protein